MAKARILIVDDEESTRELFAELLQRWGYDVDQTADGHGALKLAAETHPDVIISDLVMPKLDGLALVRALREEQPDTPVVIITGKGTIDAAVEAVREGVFDFVEKPLDPARLKVILQRALEKKETLHEMQVLRRRLGQVDSGVGLVGSSPPMRRAMELVEKVAPSKASVVITGQSGTGKEMVARAIHQLSPRRDRPFIAINCSAIPSTLIESEMFGHERGRSPAPINGGWAPGSSPTVGRSSSTRWGRSRSSCRRSSSASSRRSGSAAWAARARSRWMCA